MRRELGAWLVIVMFVLFTTYYVAGTVNHITEGLHRTEQGG